MYYRILLTIPTSGIYCVQVECAQSSAYQRNKRIRTCNTQGVPSLQIYKASSFLCRQMRTTTIHLRSRHFQSSYSMEPVIRTQRLKLTLITRAERGSQEFKWLHTLYSDEMSSFWRYEAFTLADCEGKLTSAYVALVGTRNRRRTRKRPSSASYLTMHQRTNTR